MAITSGGDALAAPCCAAGCGTFGTADCRADGGGSGAPEPPPIIISSVSGEPETEPDGMVAVDAGSLL